MAGSVQAAAAGVGDPAHTTVFLTVDTEVSMGGAWSSAAIEPLDIDTCVYCRHGGGESGVRLIMDILAAGGLAGVFFVDAAMRELGPAAAFDDLCREIVSCGNDVQLHLHPAAMMYAALRKAGPVSHRGNDVSDMLRALDAPARVEMIRQGAEILSAAIGRRPAAFRAGNYAMSPESLASLAQAGIRVDFSYNFSFVGGACRFDPARPINCPRCFGDVAEFPVTQIIGGRWPGGGHRPMEINALSAGEMQRGLEQAHGGGQRAVCVVLHSFSLLKHRKGRWTGVKEDAVVRRRLEALAGFLADHRREFDVATVTDCLARPGWLEWVTAGVEVWPRTTPALWLGRWAGQLASRF